MNAIRADLPADLERIKILPLADFHIGDLLPETNGVPSRATYEAYYKEPGTLKNRYVRYLKSNLGKKNAFDKMMQLIDVMDFVGLQQADEAIDWTIAPVVKL